LFFSSAGDHGAGVGLQDPQLAAVVHNRRPESCTVAGLRCVRAIGIDRIAAIDGGWPLDNAIESAECSEGEVAGSVNASVSTADEMA
jgi:hypothetical protein